RIAELPRSAQTELESPVDLVRKHEIERNEPGLLLLIVSDRVVRIKDERPAVGKPEYYGRIEIPLPFFLDVIVLRIGTGKIAQIWDNAHALPEIRVDVHNADAGCPLILARAEG